MTAVCSALALLLAGAGAAQAAQPRAQAQIPPVFAAAIENVYVDAFVSLRGEPVLGLTAADFELKDNGVLQRVEVASAESLPLLAVLVFDTSNSLAGERLQALKAASRLFVESLRPNDEAALFTFADETQWLVKPTTDKSVVSRAIQRLQIAGATSVMDALYAALTLPRTRSRALVVLFTDGEDNMSWLDWRQLQVVAEKSNALIHVVGLRRPEESGVVLPGSDGTGRMLPSGDTGRLEWEYAFGLRQIAETTGGRYWEAESPARLKTAFAAITEAMGQRYLLRYEPEGVNRPGWHEISLRLRAQKGAVHFRRGYWVAGP